MRHYLVGDRFGRLVIEAILSDPKNPKALCRCDCGANSTTQLGALGNGRAASCGCLRREKLLAANTTHGASGTKAYKAWTALRDRCGNPKNKQWHDYGGRGIRCEYVSFEQFIADVGERPPGAQLDRTNNDGNYAPGNCRWVTPVVNKENTRASKVWNINGVQYGSSVEAAAALGVTPSVVVRGCNGYSRGDVHHPPRDGWSCELKYQ